MSITISGVSAAAQTKVNAPANFMVTSTANGSNGKELIFTGNGTFKFFVAFSRTFDIGIFTQSLVITGSEINTKTITLTCGVSSNPGIFPSSINLTAQPGQLPIAQELTIILAGLRATEQTFLHAPDFFQILATPTGIAGKIFTFTGNGTFKVFISFEGSSEIKTFTDELFLVGNGIETKFIPVKATVLAKPTPVVNPSSLSGFTAVQAGATSAAQSFDLFVTGLLFQEAQNVFVTAPTGFLVSLSSNPATFVNSFVLTPSNGKVNAKVFVAIKNNSPVGAINGDVKITGNQLNTKAVPLSGTITAKPQPALTVSKTSITGFSTVTNKASAAQSYQLQASNLAANGSATVTAPTGYEVSLTNTTNSVFSTIKTLASSAGAINVTIFVRLKSQSTTGSKTGNVVNTVAGITKNVSVSGTVSPQPTITVNPTSLAGFNTVKNQASAAKTYTVTATNLAAGVTGTVTAPTNFEVRLPNTGSFVSTLTLTQSSTGTISRTLEVRLKATTTTGIVTGTIQNNIAGFIKNIGVKGSVAAPALSIPASSLIFTAVKNKASVPKSYKVVAANLASGNTASITAPSGFEISLKTDGVFTSTLTLPQYVTNGIATDVFVRLKATATAGTLKGNLTNSVAGLSKLIALTGTVFAPTLSDQGVPPSILVLETLAEPTAWSVKAFPNPVTDKLILTYTRPANQILDVQLFTLEGHPVWQQEIKATGEPEQIELPIREQPVGIYLLKVVAGNQWEVTRIIKQ
ncbi:T9SS type A sorting domain-containing protein [Adhaeribacter arboris]|nr:T9SS type A sorting domain-containing protein [Adhaeribacter arboris]